MIDVIDNISAYFDDDFINIIYKDLKINGASDEEIEKLLKDKHRDLPMMEINIFQLNKTEGCLFFKYPQLFKMSTSLTCVDFR